MKTLPLALLLCAGFAHADPATDNADAERKIRAALASWTDAANRGDYKATLTVWAPDMIGWPPSGADDSYARQEKFSRMPPPASKPTYALKIDEVIVDGSLAVVRDTWTQTNHGKDGVDKVETFRSFEVWRRQPDASWKISRWIDGPLMAAPPSK